MTISIKKRALFKTNIDTPFKKITLTVKTGSPVEKAELDRIAA